MATLTLTLNKDNIITAVKADTYLTGLIDKSVDPAKFSFLGYNEQAGDDQYHEVKLYRTLRAGVAKFEAAMAEYVDTSQPGASINNDLTNTSTTFHITLTVGSRLNSAFSSVLATLAEEYIINSILFSWWQSINADRAKQFILFIGETMDNIKKCLAKSAPTVGSNAYFNPSGTIDNTTEPNTPAPSTEPNTPEQSENPT